MSRRRQNDDDERRGSVAIPFVWGCGSILLALGVVAFGLSIALWIRTDGNSNGDAMLRDAFTDLQDNVTALQNCTDCQLSQTVAELQSNFSMFQNGTCTCPENAPTVTLIEQGRCIWFGATEVLTQNACAGPQVTVPGYALVSGGTGYRVGDLFTIADDNIVYLHQAMLEITSVGVSGDVLTFTVLGAGCLTLPVGNITLQTFSVVGTGLTVQLWAGAYTPLLTDPIFYAWNHATPQRWVAAPQYANWTINRHVFGGIERLVTVIYPPELPMVMQIPPGVTPFATTFVTIYMAHFTPLTPYLTGGRLSPNDLATISVTDDTSCYASGPCILVGGGTTLTYPSRAFIGSRNLIVFGTTGVSIFYAPGLSGQFSLTTSSPVDYDYVANNAVLTMSSPLEFSFTS